jgi:peptidoglycan/LPS O-acetylase OafA/YrhL
MSPIPAAIALLVAFLTSWTIARVAPSRVDTSRYASIDGLRGYLALLVFVHHAAIWYGYQRTGVWKAPPSNFYNNLGQAGVALFFSVTGFLFFDKLIAARTRGIDWLRLYVSRVLRLTPLYVFAVLTIFAFVMMLSGGAVRQPIGELLIAAMKWLGFAVLGGPALNGVANPGLFVAGVFWTLSYEWLFYLMLPMLALIMRVRVGLPLILVSVGAVYFTFRSGRAIPELWVMFSVGMGAALLRQSERVRQFAISAGATVLAVACLLTCLFAFPTSRGLAQTMLLGVFFCTVAGGNNLFGALVTAASKSLGEVAYSMYLLHGFLLFATFTFLVGPHALWTHWLIMITLTPLLIIVSHATYELVERSGIDATTTVTAAIQRWRPSRLSW